MAQADRRRYGEEGSLPQGLPDDYYARLIREARAEGVYTLLDSSGNALRNGVAAGPDLVKPNTANALTPEIASPRLADIERVRSQVVVEAC